MRSKFVALFAACGLLASLVSPASGAASAASAPMSSPAAATPAKLTAPAARKPGKPNKKWKVPTGAKFNNPMIPSKRFVIERHVLRAIRNTPKGEKITISAY